MRFLDVSRYFSQYTLRRRQVQCTVADRFIDLAVEGRVYVARLCNTCNNIAIDHNVSQI